MAASRTSSMRALNKLAAGSRQVRSLHMTGPATFPSPMLTTERPAFTLPRDLAGLRAECKSRKLSAAGSKAELIERLSGDDLVHSRAFTTAIDRANKRPEMEASGSTIGVRHFNTSRSLKAVKDTSTIDFAYLPDFDPDTSSAPVEVRVPLMPNTNFASTQTVYEEPQQEVMRPEIYTASADSTHIHAPSAMSEVHDNNVIDFQGMASRVAAATQSAVEDKSSELGKVWNGMMDDIFGPKAARA